MKCGNCGERDAVIHLTQVQEGEARTVGLCEECAAAKGIQTQAAAADTPLGGFLAALWKGPELPGQELPAGKCPGCGATFNDFRESGRLGCAECWQAFAVPLRILLRRYHGATHHLGRRQDAGPSAKDRNQEELAAELKEQLQRAVSEENFELAAELRDRLRELP